MPGVCIRMCFGIGRNV